MREELLDAPDISPKVIPHNTTDAVESLGTDCHDAAETPARRPTSSQLELSRRRRVISGQSTPVLIGTSLTQTARRPRTRAIDAASRSWIDQNVGGDTIEERIAAAEDVHSSLR